MEMPVLLKTAVSTLLMCFTFTPETEVPTVQTSQPAKGVYMVQINNAPEYDVRPYVTDELKTVKDVFNSSNYPIIVNAGFFDPNNGKTTSYVIIDKKVVLDPTKNEALMNNPSLKPHMDKILNRGEFRILKCGEKTSYDIAFHNEPVPQNCEIEHSVQAGPVLGKDMDMEKEYFVVYKDGKLLRDSISATKKVARTAIGIKTNDIYLFIATDKNPMTIQELSDFMMKKGMEKALAFDGGSSTSFENGDISVVSVGDGLGRKVKSFFIVAK